MSIKDNIRIICQKPFNGLAAWSRLSATNVTFELDIGSSTATCYLNHRKLTMEVVVWCTDRDFSKWRCEDAGWLGTVFTNLYNIYSTFLGEDLDREVSFGYFLLAETKFIPVWSPGAIARLHLGAPAARREGWSVIRCHMYLYLPLAPKFINTCIILFAMLNWCLVS